VTELSRAEADAAHVLVTTPEKWDVVLEGLSVNSWITNHYLLADERGAVIESVVARLHRWVESSQRQTRWTVCYITQL